MAEKPKGNMASSRNKSIAAEITAWLRTTFKKYLKEAFAVSHRGKKKVKRTG